MTRIEISSQLGPSEAKALDHMLAEAAEVDGQAPIDENAWRDLVRDGSTGYAGLLAWVDDHGHPVGYAHVTKGQGSVWGLESVVDPHHRDPGYSITLDLLAAAGRLIAEAGGGSVNMWLSQPTPGHERAAASIGLQPGRILYQMRRPLPYDLDDDQPLLVTRPFVVGQDEDAWLAVNNRAFAWHPEQGGWDRRTVEEHEAQPWFDPAGFRLHDNADGTLDGFCWTKIHADHDPPLGEIYVIAADPAVKRERGLGRSLVRAGLAHLADRGLRVGMLYVDAANTNAVKLYIDMGFVVHHIDQVFVGEIQAAAR